MFDYHRAFARNLGWVTEAEQAILRAKRIAIAGLGGVGGSHILTLTRLGIGAFNIADFDTFDLPNFNRQAGASLRHLGRPKVEVLAELAADINPELDLRTFPQGVNRDNLDAFLDGVDLYVDSLDFFAVETRRMVFAACAEKGHTRDHRRTARHGRRLSRLHAGANDLRRILPHGRANLKVSSYCASW